MLKPSRTAFDWGVSPIPTQYDRSDRALAQQIELCWPHIPYLVRAQRSLVRRQVS